MQQVGAFFASFLPSLRTFGVSINNKIIIIQSFRYIPRSRDLLAKAGHLANMRPDGAAEIASRRLEDSQGQWQRGAKGSRAAKQLKAASSTEDLLFCFAVAFVLLFTV